jgi:hypothetical protein
MRAVIQPYVRKLAFMLVGNETTKQAESLDGKIESLVH